MADVDPGQSMDQKNDDNIRIVYSQICESYRAIDLFRGTLLGALPLASGAGIYLLSGGEVHPSSFLPIGIFGALVTLGLFTFEIYGINRCTELITVGKVLEERHLRVKGQFATRPHGIQGFRFLLLPQKLAPYVNEPLASGIIYPTVLGAWVYLALSQLPRTKIYDIEVPSLVPIICGILVFLVGFVGSLIFNCWLAAKSGT